MTNPPSSRESSSADERERPSFRTLFDGEFSYVWNTLRRLGVAESDVLDQTQEVFVVVHGLLADYDPNRPVRPWLFAIAYRIACRYRSLARHRRELAVEPPYEPRDPGPLADQKMEADEARALAYGQRIPSASPGRADPVAAIGPDGALVAMLDETRAIAQAYVVFTPAR